MKITLIRAGSAAARLFSLLSETLTELGDDVTAYDLDAMNLPFDDGAFNAQADGVVSAIASADGAAFVFDTAFDAPNARLSAFVEYFRSYPAALRGKNCLVAADSRAAAAAFSETLHALGAAEAVRVVVPLADLDGGSPAAVLAERLAEDFYRVVRQNRPVLSSEWARDVYPKMPAPPAPEAPPAEKPPLPAVDIAALYEKHKPATEAARKDVAELTGLFAQKFTAAGGAATGVGNLAITRPGASPADKTCAQLTQALAHHVNPAAAEGVYAVFQFVIDGEGGFTGHIKASDGDCVFFDGEADRPDVTMLADEAAWRDVLKAKVSAKKAFMVGRLKVRGNFMLLTKFDEMFDFAAL